MYTVVAWCHDTDHSRPTEANIRDRSLYPATPPLMGARRLLRVAQRKGEPHVPLPVLRRRHRRHRRLRRAAQAADEAAARGARGMSTSAERAVERVRALLDDWRGSLPIWGPDDRGSMILDGVDRDELLGQLDRALSGEQDPAPESRGRLHRMLWGAAQAPGNYAYCRCGEWSSSGDVAHIVSSFERHRSRS